MANINSQKKRNRQNEKRRIRNSQVRSAIRTTGKKVVKLIETKGKNDPALIQELFKKYVKTIDNAAGKGIVNKNTAARKKSNLAKKVNKTINELT